MQEPGNKENARESLPLWERGLKLINIIDLLVDLIVAPLVGAWIEMISVPSSSVSGAASLPLWERGLKCFPSSVYPNAMVCRSPCGSVD